MPELAAPSAAVRLVSMADKVTLQTDGTTTWQYMELEDVPEWAKRSGPYLEGIAAHTATVNPSPQFEWKITFQWTTDGRAWSGHVDLFPALTTGGNVVHPEYTTKSTFGLRMRWFLAIRSTSGTTIETGMVTAVAAFRFYAA